MINRYLIVILSITVLFGCRLQTYTLQDNITKVPSDTAVYKNKLKFDASLLSIIDTGVVYEQYSVERNSLYRTDTNFDTEFYGVFRFYSNGCFNSFILMRGDVLDTNTFSPEFSGYRGVYYKEKNKLRYDLFAESNELRHIGKLTGTFEFSGDTLYTIRDVDKKYVEVYIKRKLPMQYLNHTTNW